jgi:signal transduction histidine kinase
MISILKRDELAGMPRKADFEMALDKIETGVERARRITHQLLGSVKQTDSTLSEVDLKELLEETVIFIRKEANNREIEIIQEIDPRIGLLWTDPYKLRQVLINILTNAIHATGPGGSIMITFALVGNGVEFTIQDTGQGIPREHLKKIFEPFFSTKPPGEGTGLGLFVTRSIIDKLGGKIDVESNLGQGTHFYIRLPRHPDVAVDLNER